MARDGHGHHVMGMATIYDSMILCHVAVCNGSFFGSVLWATQPLSPASSSGCPLRGSVLALLPPPPPLSRHPPEQAGNGCWDIYGTQCPCLKNQTLCTAKVAVHAHLYLWLSTLSFILSADFFLPPQPSVHYKILYRRFEKPLELGWWSRRNRNGSL